MLQKIVYRLLFLTLFSSIFSCKSDTSQDNYLSFEIDGVLWESREIVATLSQNSSLFTMELVASNGQGEKIALKIFHTGSNAANIYLITNTTNNNIIYAPEGDVGGTQAYQAAFNCVGGTGSDSIQIIDVDEFTVSGIFDATVCLSTGEQKVIRNGRFNRIFYQ